MNRILEILQELRPDSDFQRNEDFIANQLLDSFDVISLNSELEDEFNVKIPNSELIPENYQNIESIACLIKKCGGIL